MRKLITAATIAATLAVPAVSMASNGQTQKMTGNTAGYTDGTWGVVNSINETEHPQFDTVTLHLASAWNPGTSGTIGWNSDFKVSGRSGTGTFAYTVSADGKTISGIATYPTI